MIQSLPDVNWMLRAADPGPRAVQRLGLTSTRWCVRIIFPRCVHSLTAIPTCRS